MYTVANVGFMCAILNKRYLIYVNNNYQSWYNMRSLIAKFTKQKYMQLFQEALKAIVS